MEFRVTPKVGALAALAGFSLWLTLYAISALAMASGPGYDITMNYLSDLGNPRSPAPWAFNAAVILAGGLAAPFGIALGGVVGGRWGTAVKVLVVLTGAALVGVGVFPEESPYGLHGLFSIAFFLILTTALGVFLLPSLRMATFKPLGGWVTAAAFALNVILVVTWLAGIGNPYLSEHLGVYAALAWQLSTAFHLLSVGTAATTPASFQGE
jgi:hypothetical membrane protein